MRFEDLAKEGGARLQEPEKVGAGETFINRAVNMVPLGRPVVDALSTAAMQGSRAAGRLAPGLSRAMAGLPVVGQFAPVAASDVHVTPQAQVEMARMGSAPETPAPDPGLVDTYRTMRDTRAERTAAGSKQNPWAGRAGALTGFGLSLLAPLPKGGAGLKGAMATGAGYGALAGLTDGKADLTRGEFGQALEDTVEGGAMGAAMGAAGHGLMRLGQKGVQALRSARSDTLAQETLAAKEAAEEGQAALAQEVNAHREVVGKARGMMRKDLARREAAATGEAAALDRQHGQALEADKKIVARGAREAERERGFLGQARELNKRFDAKRADELERQIQEAEQAAEAERRMVGSAREMDKAISSRSRDEAGRALEMNKARDLKDRNMVGMAREMNKRPGAASLDRAKRVLAKARANNEDPNTVVLEGMAGKAHQAQQSRTKDALQYRRQMGDPDVDTKISESWQDYIDRKPEALSNPPALRRQYMKEYLQSRYPNDPERVERIMSERVGPGGDVMPRPAPATEPLTSNPSLAEEAAAAMAARRAAAEGAQVDVGQPALPPPQAELPLQAPAERSMARAVDAPWIQGAERAQSQPVLTQRPVRRGDSPAFDVGGKPPAGFEQAPTRVGGGAAPRPESSMAAPVDAPLPPEAPTRATQVPDLRRPVPLPPSGPPAAQPPARLGPGAPAAPPSADIQDVTRLAGPQDVGALAAERAAAREQNAMGAVAHAGYEGVRSGNSMLGAVFGGLAGLRREALRDPAVKARVLAAAKVQLLAQVSPEVFAKVGGQLSQAVLGGGGQYNAMRYVYARKDPQFREAEEKAAAQASRMTDDQLMSLIAGGAPQ